MCVVSNTRVTVYTMGLCSLPDEKGPAATVKPKKMALQRKTFAQMFPTPCWDVLRPRGERPCLDKRNETCVRILDIA